MSPAGSISPGLAALKFNVKSILGKNLTELLDDDWRARVRGLERVASALRTSSALIAIESRLGSLLHAVLGGERSCRVAAAGLGVAKVVVAGVSEDALRKKLPQLAWGLARQGGPSAAQLARIAMLRLKPSLLLEQLLQPHCLSARNTKTRENALQLLIFSLVTFPSTEFKLEIVASRVAAMVADRRRRVRQAALDTLAVLGQIYDSEEVIEAGRRTGEGNPDAEAMLAAIRARLARKSLPLVSADGLVVYGLQISPTVQIATGPDVDWIVAGSGSVSPGTGRSRGQIITTSRSAQGRASRNDLNNRESPWIERPNLVALGVGLQSKTEQSTAWQLQTNNNENDIKGLNGRNANAGVSSNANLRFEEQLRSFYTPLNQYNFVGTDAKNHREISDNFEQKTRNRRDINEVPKEKESIALRGESRIPILLSRERPKITSQNEKSLNLEYVNSNSRKQTTDMLDSNRNRINLRQENVGSYAAIYQRRKRFQQEESQTLNQTFDSHTNSYRSSYMKALGTNREYSDTAGNSDTIFSDDNSHSYNRFVDTDKFTNENESLNYAGGRQRSLSRNMQQQTLVEAYNSILERQRKLMDRNIYRPLRTPPNPSARLYQDSQNLGTQTPSDRDRNVRHRPKNRRTKDVAAAQQRTEMDLISSNSQEDRRSLSESFASPHRRRLRSLSPSQLHRSRHFVKLTSNRFHAASMYDICNTYPRSIYWVKRNAFRGRDRELLYETVDEASRDELQVLCGMIFKFWPIEMKEENGALVGEVRPASRFGEYKIANAVLFCCPCVFRCRKSVDVGRDNDGDGDGNASVSTIITTTTTPVIALRLNRNSDTINKATMVNEEEYNVRNRHHFSPDAKGYHVQNSNKEESRYQEFLRSFSIDARERPKSASSSSSDVSRNDRPGRGEDQDTTLRDYNGNDNSGSSTPRSQNAGDPAFDVITQQTANHQSDTRDDVDSFFLIFFFLSQRQFLHIQGGPPLTKSNSVIDFFAYMESLLPQRKFNRSLSFDTSFCFSTLNIMTPLDTNKMEYPITTADVTTVDEVLKEWSSEDDMKPASRIGSISRHSNHNELITVDENCNRSTESSSGVPEQPEDDRSSARRRSVVSALSNERILPYEDTKIFKESLQSKVTISPKRSESLYLTPNHSVHHSPISNSPIKRNSRCGSRNLIDDSRDFSEERIIASIVPDEDASIRSLDTVGHPPIDIVGDSPAIIIASRPHSHETVEYENARSVENDNPHNKINTQESTEEESSVNDALEDRQSKDSASETNMEPGILKIESEPAEDVELRRRMPSKVPVRGSSRCRMPSNKRVMEKPSEKSKRMVQQCFSQLENKDWEITMKGLKALSQISKQHPEGLDVCAAGTIGRLLGRHIKNLRSQVARAACLAASDVFSSQIRGIDQDLDDIAGPLLHRTADTNRFLRSDSNSALDQMVQYLPPHKTIGIIVLRGASHQNAIVRAATARLLSDITDRIGPDHIMILPRDVRDKLLNTGAKLLMDGNLDARNHAKKMFRRLTRCEGFRKALTDAVPETTLRHIDKTMKTL
ncbi:TGRM1 protein, partial [Acromyrmex heyeri]